MLIKSENMDPIDLANYYAKMSCTKWNRSIWEPKSNPGMAFKKEVVDNIYRLSRRYYRLKYQEMAERSAESSDLLKFWVPEATGNIASLPNTYPWPYNDRHFADWEESDEDNNYTLISDPSGCVVKYATSYCAWKIREATGEWPQRKTRIRMDAKNWIRFLTEAGYETVVNEPVPHHHFVGIDPREGEFGLVVWYERCLSDGRISVSSYVNKEYRDWTIGPEEVLNRYIWVKIT